MTIEYSNRIRFSSWPDEWQLDDDDELQLKAECESLDSIIKYLEEKVKQRGLTKNPTKENR